MKNVAGYDVTRLMVGSLGELGVIHEATLRTYAIPETVMMVDDSELGDPAILDAILPKWLLAGCRAERLDAEQPDRPMGGPRRVPRPDDRVRGAAPLVQEMILECRFPGARAVAGGGLRLVGTKPLGDRGPPRVAATGDRAAQDRGASDTDRRGVRRVDRCDPGSSPVVRRRPSGSRIHLCRWRVRTPKTRCRIESQRKRCDRVRRGFPCVVRPPGRVRRIDSFRPRATGLEYPAISQTNYGPRKHI